MRDDFEAEIMMMTIMIYGFSTLAKTQLMPHNIQLSQSDMQYITTAECPRRKTGIALWSRTDHMYRARQLRYVTELGLDIYSRFYQLPVTWFFCNAMSLDVAY